MENIIRQVIESEYRAQQIIGEAQEKIKQSESTIENEIQKIKEDVFASARKKIEEIRNDKHKSAEIQSEKIIAAANVTASLMQEKLQANRHLWTKSLLENVLNNND